jgi:hypothetical protein
MNLASDENKKCYWIVSPNVRKTEKTVPGWRHTSVLGHAAFMGYGPYERGHNESGPKFAGASERLISPKIRGIDPGDIILIARRHDNRPQIVGFGVVRGKFKTSITYPKPPEGFGSLRILRPFIALSGPVPGIPFIRVLLHTKALAQLHPADPNRPAHKKVTDWLDKKLNTDKRRRIDRPSRRKHKNTGNSTLGIRPRPLGKFKEDFFIRSRPEVTRARQRESKLITDYSEWLERQDRKLLTVLYGGRLRCDGWEKARRNLIEAKSSNKRENLRMAVGQLFDYEFRGKTKLGGLHKAVLVPMKPGRGEIDWLKSLNINVIWQERRAFLDSANGQFT